MLPDRQERVKLWPRKLLTLSAVDAADAIRHQICGVGFQTEGMDRSRERPSARMESRELQPQIRTKKRHSSQRDSKSPKVDFGKLRAGFCQYDRELGNRRWKAENRLPIAEARLRKHGDY